MILTDDIKQSIVLLMDTYVSNKHSSSRYIKSMPRDTYFRMKRKKVKDGYKRVSKTSGLLN